jgi:dolichyl-phosphate beta-glucosyltransferase
VRVGESFSAREPRIVVQREPHRGKGGAVKAGLLAASSAYRFICDADLSMPIAEIARFLPPTLTGFDVAIGSREGQAARRIGEPVYRHVMGRLFNHVVQGLALPGIADSQCGFKMFTAEAVAAIFPFVTVDGWAFDVEALAVARARGLRIVEVPIEWHYREESQVRMMRDGVGMLRELLRIRARVGRLRF